MLRGAAAADGAARRTNLPVKNSPEVERIRRTGAGILISVAFLLVATLIGAVLGTVAEINRQKPRAEHCQGEHYDGMTCVWEGYLLPGLEGAAKGGLFALAVGGCVALIMTATVTVKRKIDRASDTSSEHSNNDRRS